MTRQGGRVAGKIALVTGAGCVGAGWGNGRATAVRLAQEGATVIAVDRDLAPMEETLQRIRDNGDGDRVMALTCDVTDEKQVRALFDEVQRRHGRIDILVNNVGAPVPGGPTKLTTAQWHAQLDLNLGSVFLTCKHAYALMRGQGGAIVNIASTSGIRYTGAPQVGYACAKAGVIQFAKVVGVEWARDGVRINTVVPGQLHTPLVDAFLAKDQMQGDVESLLARRRARIPLPVEGDGRDTANAVLYLASDEARFVTCADIVVDGGMSARCD
ncbi:SDR family NAD(P)-dependent oxidoreductase [Achromobacter aloeverae]